MMLDTITATVAGLRILQALQQRPRLAPQRGFDYCHRYLGLLRHGT